VTTNPGGMPVVSDTVPLTPTSTGCSSTLASTQCSLTVSLAPGSYNASVSTFGALDVELSAGQNVGFSIVAGQANVIPMTLNGIPASIRVSSAAPGVHGAQYSGFTLYGLSTQKFAAEAIDGAGSTIVGAGSPAFSVALVGGSGFTVTNPTTSGPNTFSLTPPGTNGQGGTFTATATYDDGTCSDAGAVCSTNFTVKNDVQTLFIAHSNVTGSVDMYAAPFTGAPTQITNGVNGPVSMAIDGAGHLFIANINTNVVNEYAAPYTGAPIAATTMGDIGEVESIALDASGNLFVTDATNEAVDIFAPPFSGSPTVITNGLHLPWSIAVDSAGNFYVGDLISKTVKQFMPPYSSASLATATMSSPQGPLELQFDRTGNLFVLNSGVSVLMFSPPYTSGATTIALSGNSGSGMALDGTGALFVSEAIPAHSTVSIFNAPYTSASQVVTGTFDAQDVAIDGTGTIYVANGSGPTPGLYSYAPPYTGTATINTNGTSWVNSGPMLFSH
jgi:hypothetical protein